MGIVAAGAFAAMFSTIARLLIAAASAIGHDVYEKYVNRTPVKPSAWPSASCRYSGSP